MKSLVWTGLLASSVAGAAPECAHTSREHYVKGWEEAPSIERIYQRISPQSTLGCSYYPDPDNRLNVLVRYELGAVDGVGYKLHYADGSAVIQGNRDVPLAQAGYQDEWKLACRKTPATSAYRCTLSRGDLRLEKDGAGRTSLTIGDNHRPGSELLLRVDTNWAVTAPAADGFSDAQTAQLLHQMRAGEKADTRYHDASLQGASQKPLPLYGFAQALDIMDRILDQLNNPPAEQP
jgi:hypothetical protein